MTTQALPAQDGADPGKDPGIVSDTVSDPFWAGVRAGKLRIQRCTVTGNYQWYPRAHSVHVPAHGPGAALEWVDASGQGTVFSFSTVHRGNGPIAAPYTLVLVMLEEGVLMLSRLDDVTEDEVQIGMPVEVAFTDPADALRLPVFRRATARP